MTKMLGEKKMVRGLRSDKQMYLQIYRHITLQFKNQTSSQKYPSVSLSFDDFNNDGDVYWSVLLLHSKT